METLQFEAVKVALKQDKTGYVLTNDKRKEKHGKPPSL